MPLDPQCVELLAQIEAAGMPQWADMTPQEARGWVPGFTALMGEPEEVAKVEDGEIPGPDGPVPIRIYTPAGSGPGPLPVVIYYHGGGFVFGDLALVDPIMRMLANRSGCLVVAVDYRLAPEHPYPAAHEDCYAALEWVAGHGAEIGGEPARIAVAGDSAGGNLSAVLSVMAKERGGPRIALQVLIYPAVDQTFSQPSYQENADAPILTTRDVRYFWAHYLSGGTPSNPALDPLRADDLSDLPPALIVTAEFDPLRDEAEDYGRRLNEAGVKTEVRRYDGMVHGFVWMPGALHQGAEAIDHIAETLRTALAS